LTTTEPSNPAKGLFIHFLGWVFSSQEERERRKYKKETPQQQHQHDKMTGAFLALGQRWSQIKKLIAKVLFEHKLFEPYD
jgi:hypothetical protein